ncbi:thermonuclease family protein [Demequina mangrovi]|uniref:Uncharacterized protein n=1 Tax=Demequina mangrovi TaxID=1043493 RepID=A0A1H6TSG1_9MICO|nr:hypothetical protein [Demequina mangrovi]SEI78652.1 hypothetical protein SAMN05421637_0003 [Demequina mangrovi]
MLRYLGFVGIGLAALWLMGACDDPAPTPESSAGASPSPSVSATAYEAAAPAALEPADRPALERFDSWLTRLSEFAIDTDASPEDGEAQAAKLAALADDYPGSAEVAAQIEAAAQDLAHAHRALGNGRPATAAAAFRDVSTGLSGVHPLIEADIEDVERDSGYRLAGAGVQAHATSTQTASIVRWIDGDTVATSIGRVRLIGLDTPELSGRCATAQEALAAAEQLAPAGTLVKLTDPASVDDTDQLGRMLRYVDLVDGTDVGYSLLVNALGDARFDSRDGYDWHPREKAYREHSASVADEDEQCSWEVAASAGLAPATDDDDDEHLRALRLQATSAAVDGIRRDATTLANAASASSR